LRRGSLADDLRRYLARRTDNGPPRQHPGPGCQVGAPQSDTTWLIAGIGTAVIAMCSARGTSPYDEWSCATRSAACAKSRSEAKDR